MYRIFLLFVVTLIYSFGNLTAQKTNSIPYVNTAFNAGEKLFYKVNYGLIKGGEASLTIDAVPVGNTYLYYIKAFAETTGVIGAMVTIRDTYESYVNIHSGLPVKSIRNIREHNFTAYNEVLFFHDKNYIQSLKSGKHDTPPGILDILSAFYFARRHLFSTVLKKGEIIKLRTFFDDEIFNLDLKYKNTEKIKSKFGKINCYRFVPATTLGGTFNKEDQLQIWVTADKNYIPVKIRVKVPLGSLKCDLIGFEGIKNKNGELK
ncbi:MAG: DUF3108 domain-containing protein [Bacteroidetes bacterium]|nr:MAG: DUF3108 domain-containing protein [Bacteroidota bacterium]